LGVSNPYSKEKTESDDRKEIRRKRQIALDFVIGNIELIGLCIVLLIAAYLSGFWQQIAQRLTSGGLGEPIQGAGEPIVFLQGVSLWPSIMLRLLTATISFCLIIRGWRKLRDNLNEIADDMKLDPPAVVIAKFEENKKNTPLLERI
jgi:hypothetical protein